jgi:hypothetical protein
VSLDGRQFSQVCETPVFCLCRVLSSFLHGMGRDDVEELKNIIKTTKSKPECATLTNILLSTVDEILQESNMSRENLEAANLCIEEPSIAEQQNAHVPDKEALTTTEVQAEKKTEMKTLPNEHALLKEDKCCTEDSNSKVYLPSGGSTPVLYYMKR